MTFEETEHKIITLLASLDNLTVENTDISTLIKVITNYIAQYINLEDMHRKPNSFYEQLKISSHAVCKLLQLLPQQYYNKTLNYLKLIQRRNVERWK